MVVMNTDIQVVCHQVNDSDGERVVRFSVLNESGQSAIDGGFVVGRP